MIFEVKHNDEEEVAYKVKLDIPIETQQTLTYMYDSMMEIINKYNIHEKTTKQKQSQEEQELLKALKNDAIESGKMAKKSKIILYTMYALCALNLICFLYSLAGILGF